MQRNSIQMSTNRKHININVGKARPAATAQVATTAHRLYTPRKIAIGGEASGSAFFDGSEDIRINTEIEVITNLELEELFK